MLVCFILLVSLECVEYFETFSITRLLSFLCINQLDFLPPPITFPHLSQFLAAAQPWHTHIPTHTQWFLSHCIPAPLLQSSSLFLSTIKSTLICRMPLRSHELFYLTRYIFKVSCQHAAADCLFLLTD